MAECVHLRSQEHGAGGLVKSDSVQDRGEDYLKPRTQWSVTSSVWPAGPVRMALGALPLIITLRDCWSFTGPTTSPVPWATRQIPRNVPARFHRDGGIDPPLEGRAGTSRYSAPAHFANYALVGSWALPAELRQTHLYAAGASLNGDLTIDW